MHRTGLVLVIALIASGVAACDSSTLTTANTTATTTGAGAPTTTTATTATTVSGLSNSCVLFSRAQVAKALGQPVSTPLLGNATVEGGKACVYYGPTAEGHDPNVPTNDSVRVVVVQGADAPKWFDDYRSKVAAQPLPSASFGGPAYYDGYASLNILLSLTYIRIEVSPAIGAPSLNDAEKLYHELPFSR